MENANCYIVKFENGKKFIALIKLDTNLPEQIRTQYPDLIFAGGDKFISIMKDSNIRIIAKYKPSKEDFLNFISKNEIENFSYLKQIQIYFLSTIYSKDFKDLVVIYNDMIEFIEERQNQKLEDFLKTVMD